MSLSWIAPEFEVKRDISRCIQCRVCERQCANAVHFYHEAANQMDSEAAKCVNCQRCVVFCPKGALKIVPNANTLRPNCNWSGQTIKEIYRQAESGGILLSSMGNPQDFPIYWDKLLLNASQVQCSQACT